MEAVFLAFYIANCKENSFKININLRHKLFTHLYLASIKRDNGKHSIHRSASDRVPHRSHKGISVKFKYINLKSKLDTS